MCISELLRALCALKINCNYKDMNYSKLVAAIDDRIRANGRREITGQTLHDVLEAMVRSLGAGYQVAGVLSPDNDPGMPDQRFAWLAAEPGVYRNCGGLAVTELSWLIWGGGTWILKPMDVPFGVTVQEWIRDAVAEERSRALIAEALLQKNIDTETSDRKSADTALGGRIDTETSERKAADASEADARDKADKSLQAAIDAEEAARKAADISEAQARTDADTALGGRIDTETTERKAADTALGGRIDTEKAARESADTALDTRVAAIEGKIPATASASNKLADTDFVNSSIATATATFRGTFDTLEALKATEADNNDYAFYVHKDEAGNTCYDKYTYDGTEWKFEYRLNNSSFTAAQWAAINSGITAEVIAALQSADKANSDAITQEIADRKQADKDLDTIIAGISDALASESSQRKSEDGLLSEAINTEATARQDADTTLGERIDTEASDRQKEDAKAVKKTDIATVSYDENKAIVIDTVAAADSVQGALNKARNADRDNALAISTETASRKAAVAAEASARETGDQANADAIAAEATAREAADAALQPALVSGTNIKTINGESLLGSGDVAVGGGLSTIQAGTGTDAEVFNGVSPFQASGKNSHAEGMETTASGRNSHAEGFSTQATGNNSHAEGQYNVGYENAIHEVGIGTSPQSRGNAHTITNDGKHYILGVGGYTGTETDLTTVKDVAAVISESGGAFLLTLTAGTGNAYTMDRTWDELAAAVDAKTPILFTMSGGSYDGDTFTATLTLHHSSLNVIILQGYVNSLYLYIVISNVSGTVTCEVSEVALVDIVTSIPNAPTNQNVPGTKAVKDYVDAAVAKLQAQIDDLKFGNVLKFTIQESGTIIWRASIGAPVRTIQCSKNGGDWTDISSKIPGTFINVVAGDVLRFRGNNSAYGESGSSSFNGTAKFAASGNIMSLLDPINFQTLKEVPAYAFYALFSGCTGLTAAPELPGTTLGDSCYFKMFSGCTGLTSTPELPAATLGNSSMGTMFIGCSALTKVICLATDISAANCTRNWLSGVASSGTFVKAAAMTSWPSGISGIPEGWTVEDAA